MGQCSTLPAEGREQQPQSRYNNNNYGMEEQHAPPPHQTPTRGRNHRRGTANNNSILQVTVPRTEEKDPRRGQPPQQEPQQPQPFQSREASQSLPQPMQEDVREAPPPLDTAKRIRCYKLNLESDFVGMTGDVRVEGSLLGPFEQPPPPLTYSASDDSSNHTDPTAVAIRTAQIFRGITIAKDGTILSQNARATRSNRGNKTKRGEKSRQAAKIDKAKDLVEESIMTGKAPGTNDPANLVSLYIMGEYDEMKYLVRDGSKKLREAGSLPDDALLAINRSRTNTFLSSGLISPTSRKRVSPSGGTSNDNFSPPPSSRQPSMPQSAPPKLKGHPRDLPSSRREEGRRRVFLPVHEACFGTQYGGASDGDWIGISNGFNSIWNCGQDNGSGTASPIQVVNQDKAYHHSPGQPSRTQAARVFEGRNESNYNGRHDPANVTTRA